MGAIGNKPKRFRLTESYEEPEMLVDLKSIQYSAQKEGYVVDGRFDVERFIKEKYPTIIVKREPLASDVSGMLRFEDGVWVMTVNSCHPDVRQRYTLGHELGHYLNHRDMKSFKDSTFFRSSQKSSMEYMADLFAACLLMPESEINTLLNSGVKTVKEMANKFDVSLEAMKYRLEQLGYSIKKTE